MEMFAQHKDECIPLLLTTKRVEMNYIILH